MKKSTRSSPSKKKTPPSRDQKAIAPLDDPLISDNPASEENLAEEQFAVAGREDEAASSGRRVEPIEDDDEHNAEKLIEEGLHGHPPHSLKKPRETR